VPGHYQPGRNRGAPLNQGICLSTLDRNVARLRDISGAVALTRIHVKRNARLKARLRLGSAETSVLQAHGLQTGISAEKQVRGRGSIPAAFI
jgi:hypothetical protein